MKLTALRRTARLLAVRDHEPFERVYHRLDMRVRRNSHVDFMAPNQKVRLSKRERILAARQRAHEYYWRRRVEAKNLSSDARKLILGGRC